MSSGTVFKRRDRVTDGERQGTILKVGEKKARVQWDPKKKGKKAKRSVIALKLLDHVLHNETKSFDGKGIKWDKDHVNFSFDTQGVHFYGWWRKATHNLFSIDIYAIWERKDERGEKVKDEFTVESIQYHDGDPRKNPQSLDVDITAACNKWFSTKLNGSLKSLEELLRLAKNPTIRVTRVETIDRMIMKMREFRDVAIRSGGTRILTLTGDHPQDIPIHIAINVTAQAMLMQGKPPALDKGGMYDGIKGKRGEKVEAKRIVNIPDKANVEELKAQLKASKDKKEQRKIRAILRKMGHKGGARSKSA